MEFGTVLDDGKAMSCMRENMKYVGYNSTNRYTAVLFSRQNIDAVSARITKMLDGVCGNRPIIVPDETICMVMSSIYDTFVPQTGDIVTRYVIPPARQDSYIDDVNNQTVNVCVADVRNNLTMERNNKKLTAWTTVLGDFNANGLRSHDVLKISTRHPDQLAFNMHY